jgi:sodium transport system permease protein
MISIRNVFIIFKKEFLQLMRNKSVLFTNFVAPLVGLPLYLLFVAESAMHIASREVTPLEDKTVFQIVIHDSIPLALDRHLKADPKIALISKSQNKKGQAELETEVMPDGRTGIKIYYDNSISISRAAVSYLKMVIAEHEAAVVDEYKRTHQIDPKSLDPYIVQAQFRDEKGGRSVQTLGIGIGGITLFLLLISSFNPAINSTIGERDENTYKVLLMNPVTLDEIFLGKYLNVAVQGILSLLPYFIEFVVFYSWGSKMLSMQNLAIFTPTGMVLLIVGCVIASILLSSICFLVCAFAKTRVQAQSLISLVLFMVMIPLVLLGISEIKLDSFSAWIPIVNFPLTTMALMQEPFPYAPIFMGFASNLIVSVALIIFSSGAFKVQWQGRNETQALSDLLSLKRRRATEVNSAHAFLASTLAFIGVSYGVFGLKTLQADTVLYLIAPLVFFLGVGFLILKISELDFTKVIKWNTLISVDSILVPLLGFLSGALLITVATNIQGSELFLKVAFPVKDQSPHFVTALGNFLTFVMIPALTGEFLFRGIIFNGLRRNYSMTISTILSTLVVALVNYALYKSFTACLTGFVLAFLYERRGLNSCWQFILFFNFAIFLFQ